MLKEAIEKIVSLEQQNARTERNGRAGECVLQ